MRTIGKAVLAMRARRIMKSSASASQFADPLTYFTDWDQSDSGRDQKTNPAAPWKEGHDMHLSTQSCLPFLALFASYKWMGLIEGCILRAPMVLTYVSRWAYCEWSWKVLPSWWHTWGGAFFVSLVVWSNRSSNVYSGLLQTRSRHPLFKIEKGRRRQQNNWS